MNSYIEILRALNRSERRRVALLLVCAVLMSIVDVIGMSAILPFLSVAADPELIATNPAFAYLYRITNAASQTQFIVILGIAALVAVVGSNLVAFLSQWTIVWYSFDLGRSLSTRLFKKYVAQPYQFFVSRNSMNLTLNSTDEVEGVINGVLLPSMQIVGKALTAFLLILLVVVHNPSLALVFLGCVGGAYVVIFLVTRRYVAYFGEQGHESRRYRFRKTREAFGAIKELRILGRESGYVTEFSETSVSYSRNFALHSIIAMAPRYALETIGIAMMLIVVLYNAGSAKELAAIVPTMILYAVVGYRLMPAFQAIFGNLTTIRFNQPSLDIVAVELGRLREAEDVSSPVSEVVDNDCVKLGSSVIFESVSSRYAESEEPILQGINIVIPAFKTVGIVGSSGAGKSTFIDVLTGLLPIESGRILIDGVELSEQNVRAWRRSIGYVSQHVYLADDTVRRNIALGLHDREIDDAKVEQAARLANIHDFVTESLPEKYATMIGENGVRLSGGQRQRLGIARALYRDPSVLVMDEATSALDGITEDAVIDAVRELSSKKTIVIVAHRLTTVQHCSNIYFLENGKVSDQGVYDDLLVRNATFRQMAKVAL